MNSVLVAVIVVLGLGIVVARRRTVAVALAGAQSLALAVGALSLGASDELVAGAVLAAKAVVLPTLLLALVRRTPEPRLVAAPAGPFARLVATVALAAVGAIALPPLGLADRGVERASVALLLVGIAIVVTRRQIIHQLLGVIVAENGLSLLAVSVSGGLSWVIDLGAVVDLLLIVTVGAAFVQRIHLEYGTGDTEHLRELRDG